MKKLIIALGLALTFTAQTYSKEPYVPVPIPNELFVPIILDPVLSTPTPTIIKKEAPVPKPIVVVKETPKPTPALNVSTTHSVSGVASWYCKTGVSRCTIGHSGGYYAAIRKDLLELRGKRVLVCTLGGECVRVTIIDCNCGDNANLIDLYWDAFNAISNPSIGRVKVTIRW